ncbi:MAG: ComEC family competence protein [Rhodobacteraceae bacterium]|nr:ComEC family competence protein [Paracoccaceae bacterium]
MPVRLWIAMQFHAQSDHFFEWAAVLFACGVGVYFALRFEPSLLLLGISAGFAALLVFARLVVPSGAITLLFGVALVILGAVYAGWRSHSVAAPILFGRYYGPVEGRIVGMDRSASDALRLTLDDVRLDRVSPQDTPARVRISLHGDRSWDTSLVPGAQVMTTAFLSPPRGPVEPGGFDFRRHSWFQQIGAVGYTRIPVLSRGPPDTSWRLAVFRLRIAVSRHIRAALPGDVGGFAAAITTGDRSGLSLATIETLRATNTAHLLAISGLHMGLLTGFVFTLMRLSLALVPLHVLGWPPKKIAAVGAMGVGAAYLALAGGNVATERAFVMISVAFTAILFDRRAISLRAVAVAAMIVLALRPEALLSPGFQMSFAATAALVAVFGGLRDVRWQPRWVAGVAGLVISSAVAGLATAPVGAAHFNAVARFGLIANLLSVPVMGMLVVPAAVLSVLLAVIGLEGWGLSLMALGLNWILGVADWIAGWPDARRLVPAPPTVVLPLMALGALWGILWLGRLRFLGLVPVIAAFGLWANVQRPDVIVADDATLIGVMTGEGRAVSKSKGGGFVAQNWLEHDGDGASQIEAALRWPEQGVVFPGSARIWHVRGKREAAVFSGCTKGDLVVTQAELPPQRCEILDVEVLRTTGAIALYVHKAGVTRITVRDVTGARLWTGVPHPKAHKWWRFSPKTRTETKLPARPALSPARPQGSG